MKKRMFALVVALPLLAACAVQESERLNYPAAKRDTVVDDYFGTQVPAPYQWMEDLNSPEVKQWVEAENKLTDEYLSKIPIRGWIQQRLTQLWDYPKSGVPDEQGGRFFFRKNSGLQNQSVVYVQDGLEGEPRTLLDPNTLSPDGSLALAGYEPSPDGKLLAYQLSEGGSDWQTIHVLEVSSGKTLEDAVRWVKFSGVAWTKDNQGFYYSRYPEPPEGQAISQQVLDQKLYYHRLGTEQSADTLIYERPDRPDWIVGGAVSDNGKFLYVYLVNGTAHMNELYYARLGNAAKPNVGAEIRPLYTANDAVYEPLGDDGDTLYLQTTLDAPRGRIVAASFSNPSPDRWREVVPQGEGVLSGALMADRRLVVLSEIVAKSQLDLFDTQGKHLEQIELPGIGSVGGLSGHSESSNLFFGFTSFLTPSMVFHYDLKSDQRTVFFEPKVDFDPEKYVTEQVFYPSKDGTQIPMFITHSKDLQLNGQNPTILYGYGGFNITVTPSFNPVFPVWLEMGGVYAVANLRGGGTYGEKWHEAGMLGNKQNVFDDFAWAAKYLVAEKYTDHAHLGIQGYSNGGLLVGASITQHPELFGAAYAGAGVLDMLRYQRFSGGDLWAPEYGTSENEAAFKWLYAYSPLQNIKEGVCYPPTIITTADHDDRVVPSHSYKFAAALQHAQACDNPVLIHIATNTSHGYMPTDKRIAQTADVWAFEAWNLGIKKAPGQGEQ